MVAELLTDLSRATDSNSAPLSGATWTFYETGTTTPQAVYADADLETSLGSVVTADSSGRFVPIYFDASLQYRGILKSADGVTLPGGDIDPINTGSGNAANVAFRQSGTGAVARTVEDKLAEVLSPQDFGVVGDGTTDDTVNLQAFFDACAAAGTDIAVPEPIVCKVSAALTITPAKYLNPTGYYVSRNVDLANLTLRHSGTRNYIVLTIGTAPDADEANSQTRFAHAIIRLPLVEISGALSWPGALAGADTAIRLRNVWFCEIHGSQIYGFTKGLEVVGCAYNDVFGGTIIDCKYGRVLTTEGTDADISFTNENRFWGGRIGCSSTSASLGERYGDVITWDKVASYRGQNNNRFIGVCYEIGSNNAASSAYEVPVWIDGAGSNNRWEKLRHESGKGPLAIIDGGGGTHGYANDFDVEYNQEPGAGDRQQNHLMQVNGACGNIYTGAGAYQHFWHSGDMSKLVASSGTDASYLKGREFFYTTASPATLASVSRVDAGSGNVLAHRYGVAFPTGGSHRIGVAVDCTRIKDFEFSYDTHNSYPGRPHFLAFDGSWTLLTGNATDATWGNEPYVKGASTIIGQRLAYGTNTYTVSQDELGSRTLRVTVRDEVKYLAFLVGPGSTPTAVRGMGIKAYAAPNKLGSTFLALDGIGGLRVFSLSDDDGGVALASAKPDTAGKHGYHPRGAIALNSSAASGVASGWQSSSSTGRWLCPAWTISTAYMLGQLATNDTGKVYECTTAGTSAGSGGPTGTTATWDGITDGGAKWRYIGALATYTAMASNP